LRKSAFDYDVATFHKTILEKTFQESFASGLNWDRRIVCKEADAPDFLLSTGRKRPRQGYHA
jgi:hypothetical protein